MRRRRREEERISQEEEEENKGGGGDRGWWKEEEGEGRKEGRLCTFVSMSLATAVLVPFGPIRR